MYAHCLLGLGTNRVKTLTLTVFTVDLYGHFSDEDGQVPFMVERYECIVACCHSCFVIMWASA